MADLRSLTEESFGAWSGSDIDATFQRFADDYRRELADRRRVIHNNYQFLAKRVGAMATRRLALDGGFNVAVTLPNGETVSGPLDRIDDFNVSLHDASGAYRSFARNGDIPKLVVTDPAKVHTDMLHTYTDADIHDVTAYLVTLK